MDNNRLIAVWRSMREKPKGPRCAGCRRGGRDLSLIADGWRAFPGLGWVCPACLSAMRETLGEGR